MSEVCVVLQTLCVCMCVCVVLMQRTVVILPRCPFVDGTAGIGIRLSVVVSMLAAGHPSASPGLARVCHMMPSVSLAHTRTVGCVAEVVAVSLCVVCMLIHTVFVLKSQ